MDFNCPNCDKVGFNHRGGVLEMEVKCPECGFPVSLPADNYAIVKMDDGKVLIVSMSHLRVKDY